MWIVCTLITFFCWGTADLFYKIGNRGKEDTNHLKTGIMVGLVMGIHATIYLIITKVNIQFFDIIKYLPVSLCYILSMIIGYKGLKYLELSISSPIQNTSGVISALLFVIFFKEKYDFPFYIALLFIFIGIITISLIEIKNNQRSKKSIIKKITHLAILFPLGYCILDGLGTFLDGLYLDKLKLIGEGASLVAYEYTFTIYAFISYIYLKKKKEEFHFFSEKEKLWAAIFETGGEFFYVFAMSGNATISAPIIGSYCVLSMILSRLFLKEKLIKKEYLGITFVLIGIIILAIMNI